MPAKRFSPGWICAAQTRQAMQCHVSTAYGTPNEINDRESYNMKSSTAGRFETKSTITSIHHERAVKCLRCKAQCSNFQLHSFTDPKS